MIAFNLLPIYPLDGYRLVHDLIVLDRKFLLKEVLFYFDILLLLLGIIVSFMFAFYVFIVLFLYLIFLNSYKLIQEKRRRFSWNHLMSYDLNRYRLKSS